MTNLITPLQLFLFLSLFLCYCPPSVQIPPNSLQIYRDYQRFRQQLGRYKNAIPANGGHGGPSMKPHGPGRRVLGFADTLLVKETPANGGYFVRFGFGTPSTPVDLILDTGSYFTWMQCQPCENCYKQNDAIFDPTTSTSYKPLECKSQQCNQVEFRMPCLPHCSYLFSYGDGSFTKGELATETLTFSPETTLPDIPIGCGHDNEGQFGPAAGVFGLGRGPLSFISQSQYSAFSYCIAHEGSPKDSLLQFGSSATFSDANLTTPMLPNAKLSSFYIVGLTGISVNEQIISVRPFSSSATYDGAIVDCGTIVTRFPEPVYERFRDAFKAATGLTAVGSSGPFDTCFALTSQSEADFPVVAFHFGEALLTLPLENVMISVDEQSTCFAFAAAEFLYTIIGSHQQQGIRVSFDEDSSTVGFLPGKC